jgi:hypothetical protein
MNNLKRACNYSITPSKKYNIVPTGFRKPRPRTAESPVLEQPSQGRF